MSLALLSSAFVAETRFLAVVASDFAELSRAVVEVRRRATELATEELMTEAVGFCLSYIKRPISIARAVRSRSEKASPPEVCFKALPPRIETTSVSTITRMMRIASSSATCEIRYSLGRMS